MTATDRTRQTTELYAKLAAVTTLAYAPFWAVLGLWEAAAMNLVAGCSHGLAAFGATRGWPGMRDVILSVGLINMFLLGTVGVGHDAGAHFYLLVMAIGAGPLFAEIHRARGAVWIVLLVLTFVAVQYWLPDLAFRPLRGAQNTAIHMSVTVSMVAGLLVLLADVQRRLLKAEADLNAELSRSGRLIGQLLPASIAKRLLDDPDARIAERHENVVVLFADLRGFTSATRNLTPQAVVAMLERLFVRFDNLVDKYGLEKIKTIGDCYMVAAGVPEPRDDALEAMAALALDMQRVIADPKVTMNMLGLKVGMHIGPVVAGVIGRDKPMFDLWGDTVNVASRMESHAEPGTVHVTDAVRSRLQTKYKFIPRGEIDIKGLGLTTTFFMVER
jgi:adenylate cyclase